MRNEVNAIMTTTMQNDQNIGDPPPTPTSYITPHLFPSHSLLLYITLLSHQSVVVPS